MHIAVLDDNIADRKQIERLLDRESDRRISTTGNLYTDTFGAVDAFLASPRQYDFFMIDMKGEVSECLNIAFRIRDLGIKVPICFFNGENEFAGEELPANVLFLEKPVKVGELTSLIDEVIKLYEEHGDEYKFEKKEEEPVKKNVFKRIFEYFY
ncbi:MAG: hypothetical protein J6X80_06205 [Lachnospiraceae bacterium]|nr:hypothetical protein [Lachnospiraceae bacterium]